jgi:ornithine cyclodeaminase/alanine dehydrogenase-like protein (mu-crystallin family)
VTLLLTDLDVRRAVDQPALIRGIEAALTASATDSTVQPERQNLDHEGAWLRVMPAIVPSAGVMGLKVFHGTAGSGVRYLITLYDMRDGSVLAVLDASYLTAARTAATSAVAAKYLAPSGGTARLGVLGSGLEAETHCEALAAVISLRDITVYSPNEQRRQSFAERMTPALGVPVTACRRPEEALEGVDIVVAATNTGPSQGLACRADWLRAGQHVIAIGSTNPKLRELETAVFRRADVMVFDADPSQVARESGDVVEFRAEGGSLADVVTLPALLGLGVPGRQHRDDLTLFKSVGTALQDVVAADTVYRRAKELHLGSEVELCQEKVFQSVGEPSAR